MLYFQQLSRAIFNEIAASMGYIAQGWGICRNFAQDGYRWTGPRQPRRPLAWYLLQLPGEGALLIEAVPPAPLAGWENYYVIVGSSAGALTGLQFVVIALIAEARAAGSMREVRAFGTPNVVHFCSALLISAILSAPWHGLSSAGLGVAACGLAGLIYSLMVIRHARSQTGYHPDAEDWLWYVVLPVVAYAALLSAAMKLASYPTASLFVIAGTALLLLFIGIHNAWDTVTYVAVKHLGRRREESGAEVKRGD